MITGYEIYRSAMHSSRAVGIFGASLIVFAVLYEISKLLTALSVSEGSIGIAAIRKEVYLAGRAFSLQ